MTTGSEFGRRARPGERAAGARRDTDRPAQPTDAPAPAAEAGDPTSQALGYAIWAAGFLVVAVVALVLFLPSSPQERPKALPQSAPAPVVGASARDAAALQPADEAQTPAGQAAVGASEGQR